MCRLTCRWVEFSTRQRHGSGYIDAAREYVYSVGDFPVPILRGKCRVQQSVDDHGVTAPGVVVGWLCGWKIVGRDCSSVFIHRLSMEWMIDLSKDRVELGVTGLLFVYI